MMTKAVATPDQLPPSPDVTWSVYSGVVSSSCIRSASVSQQTFRTMASGWKQTLGFTDRLTAIQSL